MRTQCNAEQLEFSGIERRRVAAAFDGGRSARMLGRTDEAIGLFDRLAGCFIDQRDPALPQALDSLSSNCSSMVALLLPLKRPA